MGYWFNGCSCFNPVWTNLLPMGHVCLAGKGHVCLAGKM